MDPRRVHPLRLAARGSDRGARIGIAADVGGRHGERGRSPIERDDRAPGRESVLRVRGDAVDRDLEDAGCVGRRSLDDERAGIRERGANREPEDYRRRIVVAGNAEFLVAIASAAGSRVDPRG
jgi:hypothetical protein